MSRFGQFGIDHAQRLVSRGSDTVHLTPKAFDLLALLVAAAPRVLTKAELHSALWPTRIVSDATLTGLVKELRRALDDHDRAAPIVRTVHGVGFALCAAIERDVPKSLPVQGWLVIGERRLPVTTGENVVGRDPGADLWIDFDTVSRRHALIAAAPGQVSLQDLGSKNGTFVGDRPIEGSVVLEDGAALRFGRLAATWRAQSTIAATRSHDATLLDAEAIR